MKPNLFADLFKYKPRKKRPLEDFVTEAVASYFRKDEAVLCKFLNLLGFSADNFQPIDIQTQFPVEVGRIDISICWKSSNQRHTLFLENKIWSEPWKYDDEDGNPIDQIRTYCNYQQSKGHSRFVALLSNYPVIGFSKDDISLTHSCYLGNVLWKDLANIIKQHIQLFGEESFTFHYGSELYEFFRRQGMTGFSNFNQQELSAIQYYKSYKSKLEQLEISIEQFFEKRDIPFEGFKNSYFSDDGFSLAVFYNEDEKVTESDRWIFAGIADAAEDWFIVPLVENVPDVICGVGLWFENGDERDSFMEELSLRHEMKIGSFQVSIDTQRDNALFVVNRKTLHDFVETEKQEEAITEFLNIGFNEIVKDAAITNIIKKYISLDE